MPISYPVPFSHQNVEAVMPKGGFTIQEYATGMNIPYKTAVERVKVMVANGQVRQGWVRASDLKGRSCIKNYYVATK